MERVIHSFQVIETDDGIRIEIKGDKEWFKKFFSGFRGPFGPKKKRYRAWSFGPMHFGWGFWYEPWEEEEEEEKEGE